MTRCRGPRLVARAEAGFAQAFGAPARWRWFVPGRLEVFGKHTDYAGGRVLVAAVPRGFAVAAAPRADQRVVVVDVRDGRRAEIDPLDERPRPGWASYLQVTVRRFAANFPGASLGTNVALLSDLPSAAGLSSSSALVVGVATALSTRARLAERAEWQASIQRVEDLASYFGGVENGGGFGTLSGTAGVGTLGGSEDHTAILGCRAGQVSQYRFLPTVPLGHTALPAQWVFVVAVSGVHAAKAGSARDRFNRASLACKRADRMWAPRHRAARAFSGRRVGTARSARGPDRSRDFGTARWLLWRGADAAAGPFRGRRSAGAPGRRRLSLRRSRRHDPPGGGVAERRRAPARQPGARDGRARGLGPLVRSVRCHQLRRRLRRQRLGAGRSRRRRRRGQGLEAEYLRRFPARVRLPWFVAHPGPAAHRDPGHRRSSGPLSGREPVASAANVTAGPGDSIPPPRPRRHSPSCTPTSRTPSISTEP